MEEKRKNLGEKSRIFDLTGKVGLVTGGGSGLGRVFCEALAEFGASVAVADIEEGASQQTADFVKKLGRKSLAVKADVSVPGEVQHMVDETVAHFGGIDILINNAGISAKSAKIAEMAIEDWDKVMAVNLRGVFLCMRAVLPVMLKQKRGNIINMASSNGVRVQFEKVQTSPKAHYAVSKAAIIMLTREAALEYARTGIRVNCLAPGYHRTNLASGLRNEEEQREFEDMTNKLIPMGRNADPTELKGLVVYLASDASNYVTGQVFISDGGLCA